MPSSPRPGRGSTACHDARRCDTRTREPCGSVRASSESTPQPGCGTGRSLAVGVEAVGMSHVVEMKVTAGVDVLVGLHTHTGLQRETPHHMESSAATRQSGTASADRSNGRQSSAVGSTLHRSTAHVTVSVTAMPHGQRRRQRLDPAGQRRTVHRDLGRRCHIAPPGTGEADGPPDVRLGSYATTVGDEPRGRH